jgi:geranylgeranyl diphosphate synthase type I
MPGIPNELKALRAEIDTQLEAYVDSLPASLGFAVSPDGGRATDLLGEFILRPGKRLRGALAIIAYEMFGGSRRKTGLALALAVELAQDYLLMVDDVMDRSDTRRGRATIHKQYGEMLSKDGISADIAHVGDMLGLSVGLIAGHLAARVLSEIDDNPRRLVEAQRLFQTNIAATGFGQMDDLINQARGNFTIADIRRMYMLKSSYYTFVNPLQIGAVLAGAQNSDLDMLRAFGEYAGLAFQLQDDLLGMFGEEVLTGKSSMDDLREGKMTILMRYALDHADREQVRQLREALGNHSVTQQQYTQVCAVLEVTGSRNYVAQEIQKATHAAAEVLTSQASWDDQGKLYLFGLLNYTANRTE